MENLVFLSLGSNQGDREKYLENAVSQLAKLGCIEKVSSCWKTAPWGKSDQPDFTNIVLFLKSALAPLVFLKKIQLIESNLGRIRKEKWGQRVIDIDIILWNTDIMNSKGLQIPHPHAHERAFVLAPLLEIVPDISFPNGIRADECWKTLSSVERASVDKVGHLKICENVPIERRR